MEWENNPTKFDYRRSVESETLTATIDNVKEFGVSGEFKYIRSKVKLDRSSQSMASLSDQKSPEFSEEEVFLKILVEGAANLLAYKNTNLDRFFYSKDNSNIEALVFKLYRTEDGKVDANVGYKQQLLAELTCPQFTIEKVKKLSYGRKQLVRFFVEFNACNNREYTNYDSKPHRDMFNLNIRPGLNFTALSIKNTLTDYGKIDFDRKLSFRLGIESEFILPFNKNKWAILVEPTFQYFKAEKIEKSEKATIDYKSIELPIGLRYYIFLNDQSKLFINGSIIFDFRSNSKISLNNLNYLDISNASNFAGGIGYKYHDKFSLELRYQTSRNILREYTFWDSQYQTVSLILGYSLF
ncbi:outer membrane beta-barrel protein [Dyadobacter jejuensis]|nr:outer membrane beta-barrel protein [Dyadobacter jejuensis]